jgi:hypothetical protein
MTLRLLARYRGGHNFWSNRWHTAQLIIIIAEFSGFFVNIFGSWKQLGVGQLTILNPLMRPLLFVTIRARPLPVKQFSPGDLLNFLSILISLASQEIRRN